MAKTVLTTTVAAGDTVKNVLANSNFQFADNPGDIGVNVRVSVVCDTADNEFRLNADKDFVAEEECAVFDGPPRQNQDPFQNIQVSAGTQIIIDLVNNAGAPAVFRTLVEFDPI